MDLFKRDLLRALNSRYMQVGALLTFISGVVLSLLIGSNYKIGISIFGNLTTYKTLEEIALNGIDYRKGIGLLITILVSVFISQDYQYKTWQQPIHAGNSRVKIYFCRLLFSLLTGMLIFLSYEIPVYIISILLGEKILFYNIVSILCKGMIIYFVIPCTVTCLAISIKNHMLSVLISIIYILFEQDLTRFILNILSRINLDELIGRFTLTEIGLFAKSTGLELVPNMIVSGFVVFLITALIGIVLFNRQEL